MPSLSSPMEIKTGPTEMSNGLAMTIAKESRERAIVRTFIILGGRVLA